MSMSMSMGMGMYSMPVEYTLLSLATYFVPRGQIDVICA